MVVLQRTSEALLVWPLGSFRLVTEFGRMDGSRKSPGALQNIENFRNGLKPLSRAIVQIYQSDYGGLGIHVFGSKFLV